MVLGFDEALVAEVRSSLVNTLVDEAYHIKMLVCHNPLANRGAWPMHVLILQLGCG